MAKHARARHAWVTLDATGGQVRLQVHDDGIGFDTSGSVDGTTITTTLGNPEP